MGTELLIKRYIEQFRRLKLTNELIDLRGKQVILTVSVDNQTGMIEGRLNNLLDKSGMPTRNPLKIQFVDVWAYARNIDEVAAVFFSSEFYLKIPNSSLGNNLTLEHILDVKPAKRTLT